MNRFISKNSAIWQQFKDRTNHTNSSLVYLELVSTKRITPTKNIIETKTRDFAINFLISRNNFIHSSRSNTAQNSLATISESEILSIVKFIIFVCYTIKFQWIREWYEH